MEAKQKATTVLIHVILILISITMLVPFLWMMLTAFKTLSESTSVNPFVIFPSEWITDNFSKVIKNMDFPMLYLNTILLIVGRVVAAVLTATLAGYAFARLNFRGKNFMFSLVLFQMMVPGQIFIIPQYQMIAKLGATNTLFALVFPGIVSAFGTFFLRQAYMGIPDEVGEAAYLDGCSRWQTFYKVMFPLTRSSVAALTVFTAVFAYTDLMWPLIVNTDINATTLSAGLSSLNGQFSTNYPVLMAGSLLAMLPMVVLYLIFQRQFIEGVAMTGGK